MVTMSDEQFKMLLKFIAQEISKAKTEILTELRSNKPAQRTEAVSRTPVTPQVSPVTQKKNPAWTSKTNNPFLSQLFETTKPFSADEVGTSADAEAMEAAALLGLPDPTTPIPDFLLGKK